MIALSRIADLFVHLADTLVSDFDLVDFLQTLTDHAAEVSGAAAVGLVLADQQGQLHFMAASNDSARALELFQIQASEGPCRDCFTSGQPVINADLAHASNLWPEFAPHAISAGFESVHAFPMRLRNQVIGALNLFGDSSVHFEESEIGVVQALSDVATIALLQERSITRSAALTEQLQSALNTRIVIEQAKGAIAAKGGMSVEEAFAQLRHRARTSGRKIADVAAEVLAAPPL